MRQVTKIFEERMEERYRKDKKRKFLHRSNPASKAVQQTQNDDAEIRILLLLKAHDETRLP